MSLLRTLAVTLLLAPGLAQAEGAAREVDCEATRICDAAGDCTPSDDHVRFLFEPLKVGDEGIGTYTITYGEISAKAEQVGPLGPILWRETADDMQSLVQDGATGILWHRFMPGATPNSHVVFLTCEVTR